MLSAWRTFQFLEGKWQEREQRRATRKRLRQGLPEFQLVAAVKHVLGFARVRIYDSLIVRKELGNALNLIENDFLARRRKKSTRVCLSEISDIGVFQRHVTIVWKCHPERQNIPVREHSIAQGDRFG